VAIKSDTPMQEIKPFIYLLFKSKMRNRSGVV